MTHRLLPLLRSPRAVAGVLALAQAILCGLAVAAIELGTTAGLMFAAIGVSIGVIAIWAFERVSGRSAPAREGASVGPPAVVPMEEAASRAYQDQRRVASSWAQPYRSGANRG